eukprot:6461001-Pyramimonas_sp.AAC.1
MVVVQKGHTALEVVVGACESSWMLFAHVELTLRWGCRNGSVAVPNLVVPWDAVEAAGDVADGRRCRIVALALVASC